MRKVRNLAEEMCRLIFGEIDDRILGEGISVPQHLRNLTLRKALNDTTLWTEVESGSIKQAFGHDQLL